MDRGGQKWTEVDRNESIRLQFPTGMNTFELRVKRAAIDAHPLGAVNTPLVSLDRVHACELEAVRIIVSGTGSARPSRT